MSDEKQAMPGIDVRANHSNTAITIELGGKALAIICGLSTILVALGVVVGLNMSRQASIENGLRTNTVALDLAKYNAQEVRIQAEVNKILSAAILARGCGK